MRENRKHTRRPIEGAIGLKIRDKRKSNVLFEEAGLVTGVLKDISKSGLGLRVMDPIDTGTPVIVKKIRIVREPTGYDMLGTVAWIKATGDMYSIGISLEEEITPDLHSDLN